ncbi:hypothetical protein CV770_26710 [Bradyrhizobium sp. AC87j1]|nr:hypothetical protein CV770_26710 [Bradyrhizobium sp. AC87j1]
MTSSIVRALSQEAQHRLIAVRYNSDARTKRQGKRPPAANLRVWELERVFRHRFGKFIPEGVDGRQALQVIAEAYHFSKGGDPVTKLAGYIRARAPWAYKDIDAIVAGSAPAHWQSADELAWRIGLTFIERESLKVRTIGAVGLNKRQRSAIQKAKHKQRESDRRRARGAKSHTESLDRTRPWEAEGISRRTWFRRRAAEDGTNSCGVFSSNSNAHESVPSSICSLREALRAGARAPRPDGLRHPEQAERSVDYYGEGKAIPAEAWA